jgi:DNA polymerase
MSQPRDLIPHLRFYADLGVNGISRDPAWRERQSVVGQGSGVVGQAFRPGESGKPEGLPYDSTHAVDDRADDPATALAALREDIGDCTRCVLHTLGRRQIVFGAGNPAADLMFVGEAPGADEDVQGVPFVGRAGQLLTKIIAAINLTRDEVYIANVIKCRPPGNRNPEPVEVATCSPFLQRQIDTIRPKVIVALGTFAAQMLLQTKTPISRLRGQVHEFRDGIKVIPTFHPSFLLRNQQNRAMYRDVWEDMKKARAILDAPN